MKREIIIYLAFLCCLCSSALAMEVQEIQKSEKAKDDGIQSSTGVCNALKCGHIRLLKALIAKENKGLNLTCNDGFPLFFCAVQSRNPSSLKFLLQMNDGLVVKEKVSLDEQNVFGDTALIVAVKKTLEDDISSLKMIKLLIRYGADIHKKNRKNKSAFDFALKKYSQSACHLAIVDIFLAACEKKHRESVLREDLVSQFKDNTTLKKPFDELAALALVYRCRFLLLLLLQEKLIHAGQIVYRKKQRTLLHEAASLGMLDVVKELLLQNSQVDVFNMDYETPLHRASSKGCSEVVEFLILQGASVNMPTGKGDTSLFLAALHGHKAVVQILLKHGAQPKIKSSHFTDTLVALFAERADSAIFPACENGDREVVELLLKAGASPNESSNGKGGLQPIHYAARSGNGEVIALLLSKRASLGVRDHAGRTPLHHALAGYITESVLRKLIEAGEDVNARNHAGETPLYSACHYCDKSVIELLIKSKAHPNAVTQSGQTPICAAIECNPSMEVVEFLLAKGAKVNSISYSPDNTINQLRKGIFSLFSFNVKDKIAEDVTIMKSTPPLWLSSHLGKRAIVELLLNNRANVNDVSQQRQTALHAAARSGYLDIAQILIANGSDVAIIDLEESTALHCAAESGNGELIALLMSQRLNPMQCNKYGQNALHKAAESGKEEAVCMIMNQPGVDINAQDNQGRTSLLFACKSGNSKVVAVLLKSRADVSLVSRIGEHALYIATQGGFYEVIQLLVAHMKVEDINFQNPKGETALHCALENKFESIAGTLIEKGASATLKNRKGLTPLHYACWHGYINIVEIVTSANPNFDMQDMNGETPLHFATRYGHSAIIEVLLQRGARVDSGDQEGETPLHKAVKRGNAKIVQTLLQFRADPLRKNNKGKAPLDLAKESYMKMTSDSSSKKTLDSMTEASRLQETAQLLIQAAGLGLSSLQEQSKKGSDKKAK